MRNELGLGLVDWTFRMPNLDKVLPPEGQGIAGKVMPPRPTLTRVLVGDDQLAACRLLSILLGPPDYRCAMASNGQEALLTLHRAPVHPVNYDLPMTGMTRLA